MTPTELRPYIQKAWSSNTTWCPETFKLDNPAHGQCGVTSIFFALTLGAKIIAGEATPPWGPKVRHYWNELNDVEFDETSRQFPPGTFIVRERETSVIELLENEWFIERYQNFLLNFKLE